MSDAKRCLAIVTGASRGFGVLITLELTASGLDVLMVGRDSEGLDRTARLASTAAGKTYPLVCDLEGDDAVETIVQTAERRGGAAVLVNNAAIQGPIGPAWENGSEEFDRTVRVNFLIPAALTRAVIPGMIARGAGWIINISGGGATSPRPMFSAYSSAKTALVRFGETLAAEARNKGVRVNSIAPGAFASGMSKAILQSSTAAGAAEASNAERLLAAEDDASARKAAKLVAYLVAGPGRDITGKLISAVWDPWTDLPDHWHDIRDNDVYTLRRIVPVDRKLDWGS
jgi:NAD(P)-dependent dehydrogenase (short-subunit alcohol dehydrogenase family)